MTLWKINYYYVNDIEKIVSNFNESYVYKSKNNNRAPKAFEPIVPDNLNDPDCYDLNQTELTKVILKWEDTKDPDEDEISYRLYLSKNQSFQNESTIIKDQIMDTQLWVELSETWDDSDIYWKVRAIDNFGKYFETEAWNQDYHLIFPYFSIAKPVIWTTVLSCQRSHLAETMINAQKSFNFIEWLSQN